LSISSFSLYLQALQQNAAVTIQRMTRGYLVRHQLMREREAERLNNAAVKIQCLARGVKARVLRTELSHHKRIHTAAISIQKVARVYLVSEYTSWLQMIYFKAASNTAYCQFCCRQNGLLCGLEKKGKWVDFLFALLAIGCES